mmetsp:Transcript_55911/g.155910  ORF Transcript_55911/g.155910 Transcript_55911/m.155910 type:complete len:200 (+) Transcript_55911:495-1094(+)
MVPAFVATGPFRWATSSKARRRAAPSGSSVLLRPSPRRLATSKTLCRSASSRSLSTHSEVTALTSVTTLPRRLAASSATLRRIASSTSSLAHSVPRIRGCAASWSGSSLCSAQRAGWSSPNRSQSASLPAPRRVVPTTLSLRASLMSTPSISSCAISLAPTPEVESPSQARRTRLSPSATQRNRGSQGGASRALTCLAS